MNKISGNSLAEGFEFEDKKSGFYARVKILNDHSSAGIVWKDLKVDIGREKPYNRFTFFTILREQLENEEHYCKMLLLAYAYGEDNGIKWSIEGKMNAQFLPMPLRNLPLEG